MNASANSAGGARTISRRASAAVILLATSVMSFVAWWFGLRAPAPVLTEADRLASDAWLNDPSNQTPAETSPMRERGGQQTAFKPGAVLPPLAAEGWINGPAELAAAMGYVWVVDVWDDD